MKYELAKKLKEAGFPQNIEYGDNCFYLLDETKYNISNSDDMGEATGHYQSEDKLNTTCGNYYAKIPTLSELIEACVGIGSIDFANPDYFPNIVSFARKGGKSFRGIGLTKEESVANLWLELNPQVI